MARKENCLQVATTATSLSGNVFSSEFVRYKLGGFAGGDVAIFKFFFLVGEMERSFRTQEVFILHRVSTIWDVP